MDVKKAASNTLLLVHKHCNYEPIGVRADNGKSFSHAIWLLKQVEEGQVEGEKAHRWLGWAQCSLAYEGVVSLEASKCCNVFA